MDARVVRFTSARLDGVELHTLRRGPESGPPVVLLHGGGANAHWWDHIAPALARRHPVVALDFRGHGDSDHPERVELGAFRRDLAALLEHLEAPDAVLIGHSMGGHVALEHAAWGGRPRAVVAIDVARGAAPRMRRLTRRALATRRSYRSRQEAIARYRFLPPAPAADEALRRAIAEHSVCEEADGRFGFKFDPRWFALPPEPEPPLERIACPTLVVRGGKSSLLSAEGAAELVAQIPGARLCEISDAGHNVHLERPGEVLRALEEFLAGKLDPPTRGV
jgi:pimeloyl-ACP methyl ester carboxylesterase